MNLSFHKEWHRKFSAAAAAGNLRIFLEQGWRVLEPATPFVPGIHVDAICKHLQAITENRIANLIINVPPGHAKSLITCVYWPAWVWINHPQIRFIFASYRTDLSTRDSVKCRTLIGSGWYQGLWGDRFELRVDQNQKTRFENSKTGYRLIASIGAGTGERGDIVVVDDPTSVDGAESPAKRNAANRWWTGSMTSRRNDLGTGHMVVIQQRLHEDDLTGHLMGRGGYELLFLPEEFESHRVCATSIGWKDPRTEDLQLLWPQKISKEMLATIKRDLGAHRYAGQYQQRPSPAGGGILKSWWFRYWKPKYMNLPAVEVRGEDGKLIKIEPVDLPEDFDEMLQSWDMSFKNLDTSDYVAGGLWGKRGANRYLIDQERGRWDFPQTIAAVERMTHKWPKASLKLVEDKANGSAVIQTLRNRIQGLVGVEPQGGKIARAQAVTAQIESGNVFLPHPQIASWHDAFVEECATFPFGRNDDQVDQMTQALIRMRTMPQYSATSIYQPPGGSRAWMNV